MAAKPLPPQDYLRECINYDPETGALTWRARPRGHFSTAAAFSAWITRFANRPVGTPTKKGYRSLKLEGVSYRGSYYVHRLIFKLVTGQEPPACLDHKNGARADNRWQNLRPATDAENKCNRGATRTSGSGLKGVFQNTNGRGWSAKIGGGGKSHYLGSFDTPEAAHAAYCEAAARLHGEFARTA